MRLNHLRYKHLQRLLFFILIFFGGVFFPAITDAQPAPSESWVTRYNGPGNGNDSSRKIVVDGAGNTYVTGESSNGASLDYATAKYDPAGNQLWTARYDNGSTDQAFAITVDGGGNVYVTGSSFNTGQGYDYATVKYDSNGVQQWVARYNQVTDDNATSIAVDNSGNVYVTGYSAGANITFDFATVKYDSNGIQQWVVRYDTGAFEYAVGVGLDSAGNVYVSGDDGQNKFTSIKYDSNGTELWVSQYPTGFGQALAQAVDSAGNTYVTGASLGSSWNFTTVKFDPNGNHLWAATYDNPGNYDQPNGISLDSAGNVFVTGYSGNGSNDDYATVKYDPNGAELWVARYDNGGSDQAAALSLDSSGNAYVIGRSSNGLNNDYAAVKYAATDGQQLWVVRYDNGGEDFGSAIALDGSGNAHVTGTSSNGTNGDYTTIKYERGSTAPQFIFGGFLPP